MSNIVYSISEAHRMMEMWTPDSIQDEFLPDEILTAISLDEDNAICGTAHDYHNLISEYAKKKLPYMALQIAILGTKRYPRDVDLLADTIRFGCENQDWLTCKTAYNNLKDIPKEMWTWRSYTFAIDYLKVRLSIEDNLAQKSTNIEILELINHYKESNLMDERAWVAEAELYMLTHNFTKAIKALQDGIEKINVAPVCCLKLSDIYLTRGEYEKVIKYSAIGIRATAQEQPSVSTGYLYYVSALAKDALIHNAALEFPNTASKGFFDDEAVKNALLDYDIAESLLRSQSRSLYLGTINMRKTILQKKSGIKISTNISSEPTESQTSIWKNLLESGLLDKLKTDD